MGEQDAQNWAARSHRDLYETVHAAGPAAEAARAAMPEPAPFDLDETLERLFARGGIATLYEAAGDLRPAAEHAWRAHDQAVSVMAAFASGAAEAGASLPQQTDVPRSSGGSRPLPPMDVGAGHQVPRGSASPGAASALADGFRRSDPAVPSASRGAVAVLPETDSWRSDSPVTPVPVWPGAESGLRDKDSGRSELLASSASAGVVSGAPDNEFRRSDPPASLASGSPVAVSALRDSDFRRVVPPAPSASLGAASTLADGFRRTEPLVSSASASAGPASSLRRNDPRPGDLPRPAASASSAAASALRGNDFRRSDPPVPPASAISGAAGGATHRPGVTNSPRPPGMRTTGPAIPGSGGVGSLCPGAAGFGGAGSPGSGGGAVAVR
ncbi:hypothetical protein ACFWQL_37270, partial [Amycolatopsis thermoflava]|uniref:hypothetical protein n=1 Tax=Amycolatopsis thermoflava TaxID=84480 RepID=UPI00366601D9